MGKKTLAGPTPIGGTWVHARGEYVDADKTLKCVAVSISLEHVVLDCEPALRAAGNR
jgi:hypothetical protein